MSRTLSVHPSQACRGGIHSFLSAAPTLPSLHLPLSAWFQMLFVLLLSPVVWLSTGLEPLSCLLVVISPLPNRQNAVISGQNPKFRFHKIRLNWGSRSMHNFPRRNPGVFSFLHWKRIEKSSEMGGPVQRTVTPVGIWVIRTAVSTLFTFWPPFPPAREKLISRSSSGISTSIDSSGRRGMTSTPEKLVCVCTSWSSVLLVSYHQFLSFISTKPKNKKFQADCSVWIYSESLWKHLQKSYCPDK